MSAETEKIWVFMGRRGKTTTTTLMEAMVSNPKIAIFSRMFIVSPLCLVSVPAFSPVGMFV